MVYLVHITNVDDQLHKIGRTNNIDRRLTELSREFCTEVTLVDSVEVDNDVEVEDWLHGYFGEYRVDGELFLLDERSISVWRELADIIGRSRGSSK